MNGRIMWINKLKYEIIDKVENEYIKPLIYLNPQTGHIQLKPSSVNSCCLKASVLPHGHQSVTSNTNHKESDLVSTGHT